MSRIIIGLVGTKGSGKDSVAAELAHYGFQNIKFAAALKDMLRALLLARGTEPERIERMIEGDLKEIPVPELEGRTPRHAMVTIGTEWGRELIGPGLWINIVRDRLNSCHRAVVTDVRFINEAATIRQAGGMLWRVTRPGFEAQTGHASETEMESITTSVTIKNDGTLDALQLRVQETMHYVHGFPLART